MDKLQFITDGRDVDSTVAQAAEAIAGGCRWVQIRMKDAADSDVLEAARRILPVARTSGVTVIIDDRVHLVKVAGVDGVHLGKEDMRPAEARRVLGPDAVIGVTVNTLGDILYLDHAIIDYMGMGPFRFTTTKKKLAATLGLEGYRKILSEARSAGVTTPVAAIGGITISDVPSLMAVGVNGVAVSGAISHAENPAAAAREFLKILNQNTYRHEG